MKRRLVITNARSASSGRVDMERLPMQILYCAIVFGFGGLGAALVILEEVLRNSAF